MLRPRCTGQEAFGEQGWSHLTSWPRVPVLGGHDYAHTLSLPFTDFWHQKNADYNSSPFHISQCFVLKLSDLQTVNVGLFDQYFRLTGEQALCPVLFWVMAIVARGLLPCVCGCVIAGRVICSAHRPVRQGGRKQLQELLRVQNSPPGGQGRGAGTQCLASRQAEWALDSWAGCF